MKTRMMVLTVGVLAVVAGACGGGDDGGSDGPTKADAKGGETTTTVAAAGSGTVPQFASEFERVCTTQVGYPGVKAYEKGPGTHPVALFEDYRGEGFVSSSRTLPAGWAVQEDTNFEDNAELEAVELVACSDRVKETPTGKMCEFDDDGTKIKLELVDATYEVKIYAAATGKEVGATTLEAKSKDCPYVATFKKGDKTFVTQPSDDDYTNALKPYVAI